MLVHALELVIPFRLLSAEIMSATHKPFDTDFDVAGASFESILSP